MGVDFPGKYMKKTADILCMSTACIKNNLQFSAGCFLWFYYLFIYEEISYGIKYYKRVSISSFHNLQIKDII